MAKIVCEKCGSEYKFEIAKDFECCPVCKAHLMDDDFSCEKPLVEKKTYYYYKEGGGTLDDMLFDGWNPLYTFQAENIEDAKEQLKEVYPDSPLLKSNSEIVIRCPRCMSRDIQLVPRKFSLATGFATSKVDRMCVACKKRF